MTLKEYLQKQNKNMYEAARELNFHPNDVRRYAIGEIIPRAERVKKIYEWSGGLVTANDFYFSNENGGAKQKNEQ